RSCLWAMVGVFCLVNLTKETSTSIIVYWIILMRPVRSDLEFHDQTREPAPESQYRPGVTNTGTRLQNLWVGMVDCISSASRGARALPALLVVVTAGVLSVCCGGTGDENAPPPVSSMGGQLGFGGVILG